MCQAPGLDGPPSPPNGMIQGIGGSNAGFSHVDVSCEAVLKEAPQTPENRENHPVRNRNCK